MTEQANPSGDPDRDTQRDRLRDLAPAHWPDDSLAPIDELVAWIQALPPELAQILIADYREAADRAHQCFIRGHTHHLDGLRHHLEVALERAETLRIANDRHLAIQASRIASARRRAARADATPSRVRPDSALARHARRRARRTPAGLPAPAFGW